MRLLVFLVFVMIFFTLLIAFGLSAGAYFNVALGNDAMGATLQVAGGAFAFVAALSAWWVLFAQMLASVDFPFSLPVGDLSTVIRGYVELFPLLFPSFVREVHFSRCSKA